MVILTTSYNCEKFIEKSLFSIMSQRHKDFTCYITDDVSTDNTVNIVRETIKNDPRFILIENKTKFFQPGNYDQIITSRNIDGEEICVEVDGDDWSPDSNGKKIKPEDLRDENNNYWNVAGDLSFMFPMFEMSGEKHYRFLSDINYIYNESNPINDHKVNMRNVMETVNKIRNKTEYKQL